MESTTSSHHLAAIMFTDIAGYTRMMQQDEHAAMEAVRKYHRVLDEQVIQHHGQIQNHYGDGSLSLFHSAIQAVTCALEMQIALLAEPRVDVRIGIHIGEIYTEDGKVFGDGVNIASRIESIGQGGAVLFSSEVYQKIRNNNSLQAKLFGRFEFKNVDEPVEVYCLCNAEIQTPDRATVEGKLKERPARKRIPVQWIMGILILLLAAGYFLALRPGTHKSDTDEIGKSIAVLPFKNLSPDTSEEFLSIGIAEDILTQLAQVHGLKVISRSSSMQYKNTSKSIKTIAKELGVANILEGSVRQFGENLRISVQLTNGMSESLIWAADFDRKVEDILNLQRDVALTVSEKLRIALRPEIKDRLEEKLNVNPEAYLLYQHGQDLLKKNSGTAEDMNAAIGYFEKSIAKDSTFSKAWIGLADAWLESVYWHRVKAVDALPKAKAAAYHALELDPDLGESYAILGAIGIVDYQIGEAEVLLRKAITLNPNDPFAHERLSWVMLFKNQPDDGVAMLNTAIELDPLSTRNKGAICTMHYLLRRFDEGIRRTKVFLAAEPTDNYLLWSLAYLQTGKGDYNAAIDNLLKRSIGTTTNWVLAYCYAKTGKTDLARTILNNNLEKSKTQKVPDFMMAVQYCALGEKSKAMDHLEQALHEEGEGFFVFDMSTDPMLESLWNDPRFRTIAAEAKQKFTYLPR